MERPWYKKATVQAAIVNSISQLIIGAIAIIAIIATYYSVKTQLQQDLSLSIEKYKKDSILVEMQLELARNELKLISNQYELNRASASFDSIMVQRNLYLIEKDQNLELYAEKEKLRYLCQIIWDRLEEYYTANKPMPQAPLKPGEERITSITNKLSSSYELQNNWAKDIYDLLLLGYRNKYFVQCDSAKPYWQNTKAQIAYIKYSTNQFLIQDSTFIEQYHFDKTVQEIWGNFVQANKFLFN